MRFAFCVSILFALCIAVVGCGVPRLTTYEQGVEYLDDRDYPRAIEWFKRDIEENKANVKNTYNLGVCYQDLAASAQAEAERIERIEPQTDDVKNRLAAAKANAAQLYEQAIDWYERALEIRPKDARSMVNLAMIHLALKRDLTALALLERASEAENDRAYPLVALGIYYQKLGNQQKAGDYYRAALKREQKSAYAWFNYASWNEENGLIGDAAQAYEKAAELDPSDVIAFESAARCFTKQKNYSAASRNYDYAIALAPDRPQLYIDAADVLTEQQRYERATQYLWTARTLVKHNDPAIHARLLKLYKLMHEAEGKRVLPKDQPR